MNQDSTLENRGIGCAQPATIKHRETWETEPYAKNAEQSLESAPQNSSFRKKLTPQEMDARAAAIQKENLKRCTESYKRDRRLRWAFPVKVRVIHPLIGEAVVPAASKYAAILCACEMCGKKYMEIHDAKVETQ